MDVGVFSLCLRAAPWFTLLFQGKWWATAELNGHHRVFSSQHSDTTECKMFLYRVTCRHCSHILRLMLVWDYFFISGTCTFIFWETLWDWCWLQVFSCADVWATDDCGVSVINVPFSFDFIVRSLITHEGIGDWLCKLLTARLNKHSVCLLLMVKLITKTTQVLFNL